MGQFGDGRSAEGDQTPVGGRWTDSLTFPGEQRGADRVLSPQNPGYTSQFLRHRDSPFVSEISGKHRLEWNPDHYQRQWWSYAFSNGRLLPSEVGDAATSAPRGDVRPLAARDVLEVLGGAVQEMHSALREYTNVRPGGISRPLKGDEYLSILSAPDVLAKWRALNSLSEGHPKGAPGNRMNEFFNLGVSHLKTSMWGVKSAIKEWSSGHVDEALPSVWIGFDKIRLDEALLKLNDQNIFHFSFSMNDEQKFHCLTYAITVLNGNDQQGAYKQCLGLLRAFIQSGFSLDYQSATNSNTSLLMLAAGWGNEHFVEALLDSGANWRLTSSANFTAANYAHLGGFGRMASQIEDTEQKF